MDTDYSPMIAQYHMGIFKYIQKLVIFLSLDDWVLLRVGFLIFNMRREAEFLRFLSSHNEAT